MPSLQGAPRFVRACFRQKVDRTPVWFMRQAGRYMKEYRDLRKKYSILQLAKTPELACEVTLQPIRAMPIDAAIIFADILLPIEPMGARLRFAPGPVIDNPVRSAADVRRLKDFDSREGLSFVLRAIALARRELGPIPLIGFAGAPFTLASYLIEGGPSDHFLKTKAFMLEQPKAWDQLMGKVRRITAAYLKAQVEAGAQAVQLFDSWVGCLSPEQYRKCVLPHSRFVLSALKSSGVPVIHFGTGTAGFLEDFASAGGDVIGVDWRLDLDAAWGKIGARAIQGNLDPTVLFAAKPVLKSAVRDILARACGRKGFIFNLGHGILPQTPVENVKAVVDWVHAWSLN
ncbi:MAG: uroporphyrinogen decarboxylase [Elusimicrobia bacterium]|nr:uroporphyrinogen decarboxylase [Elusimicrobiota bacterium]